MHRILIGDVRDRLKQLQADSVHCVVTSCPYWGLRDYKAAGQIGLEASPLEWVAVMVDVFREIRRVLRPDGVVWLNLGDKYAGSGCGGSNASGTSTLEGSFESQNQSKLKRPRRPDECAATQRLATTANVGRQATRASAFRDKQRLMLPARLALALQDDGWWVRDEIVWFKSNPMPSSVTDRTTPAHEMVYLLTKRPRYYFDALAIAESATFDGPNSPGSIKSPHGQGFTRAAAVPSGWDQENARHDQGQYPGRRMPSSGNKARKIGTERGRPDSHLGASVPWEGGTRNKRSVWTIATEPFAEAHFATFPTGLVEPCILAGTSHRGVCPACGAQWRRIERKTFVAQQNVSTAKGMRAHAMQKAMDESSRWEDTPRGMVETMTLGWYPSCRCGGVKPLPKLLRITRRKNEAPGRTRQRKDRALQKWEKLAQPLIEKAARMTTWVCPRRCTVLDQNNAIARTAHAHEMPLSAMQEDVPAEVVPPVALHEAVRPAVDSQASAKLKGVGHYVAGLPSHPSARAPELVQGRVHAGASAGDGEAPSPTSEQGRGGASPQRRQTRQSNRKSGASDKEGARLLAGSGIHRNLPRVSAYLPGTGKCARCGSVLERSTSPTVPAVVLDPFSGAGTTLLVADRLARDSIGIEINPEFADMAVRRMAKEASLFAPKVEHAGQ